ncbi:MAG: hypothetical protein QME66_05790 [Candidatus Eisenbacteria bacterium]|nr:hypothetical protein [Candidatus Eisenbacteria bacterium]
MRCERPGHRGDRVIHRLIGTHVDGKYIEGCHSCVFESRVFVYPTVKRDVFIPSTGKSYRISAAHRRDIKLRRVAPDLSHVWRDKRGIGSAMTYLNPGDRNKKSIRMDHRIIPALVREHAGQHDH